MQRHTSCVLATGKKKFFFFFFFFFLLLLLFRRKYDEVRVESLVEIKHTSLSLLFAISNVIDRISLSQRNFFFRWKNCFSFTKTENICLVFEYCFADPHFGIFGIFQKHSLFHSSRDNDHIKLAVTYQ